MDLHNKINLLDKITSNDPDAILAIQKARPEQIVKFFNKVRKLVKEYENTRGLWCTADKGVIPKGESGLLFHQLKPFEDADNSKIQGVL